MDVDTMVSRHEIGMNTIIISDGRLKDTILMNQPIPY